MSYNFGYTPPTNENNTDDLETKIAALDARRKQNKAAIVLLATDMSQLNPDYKTVFELNVFKATKTFDNPPSKKISKIQQGPHALVQRINWSQPSVYTTHILNNAYDFMYFSTPYLLNPSVSVFIILEALTTTTSGSWCYIFGNDNGSYDKFLGYSPNVLNKLCYGGSWPVKKQECTLPSSVNIKKKHLISIHWLMIDSCLYANGVKINGSEFTSNFKHIGEPYGTIFYNDRLPSSSSAANAVFMGKIYGMKIITGEMTSTAIQEEHKKLIQEYNVTV